MARKSHQQVHARLTEWADSAPPLPSPALAQFMGPVRPKPVPSGRAMRVAVRTGLGIKVFGLLAAMAVTGAAAVGVTQVASHEPEPPAPVVVPVVPSHATDATSTEAPDDDPATDATPSPSTTPRPRPTSTAPTAPRVHRTHSAEPSPRPHESSDESEAPDPSSSDAPDHSDPTTDAAAGDATPAD